MLHHVENSYEKTLYRIYVCKISMCTYVKKIETYIKDRWIYMNTCYNYISYEKQGKVLFVIQYQCNVSVNSPWASINTNFYFITCSILTNYDSNRKKTTDTTLESGITEDATSGRERLFKNFIYNAFVWKYPLWNM